MKGVHGVLLDHIDFSVKLDDAIRTGITNDYIVKRGYQWLSFN